VAKNLVRRRLYMGIFFKKRDKADDSKWYENLTPAIRASICTGEKSAGFMNKDGKFEELMLIKTEKDLVEFCKEYNVEKDKIKTFW